MYRYDGKSFTNLTTKEGLANDRVGCFYEDKAGNIWIGTEGGASRYDGKSFRNFTTKDGLTNNDINSILEDKTGKFWFATRGDACFYDGATFTRFTNKEGAPFKNVRSIIEDRKGNLWIGGRDGLWRYDGSTFTNLEKHFFGYLYEDKTGNVWASSEAPDNSQKWVIFRYDEKSLLSDKPIVTKIRTEEGMFFGIMEDKEGNIWFGSLNGVCRYDGKSFNYFKHKEFKDSSPPAFSAIQLEEKIRPLLVQYCVECHAPGSDEDLDFLAARTATDVAGLRDVYARVLQQLEEQKMPPDDFDQPTDADRKLVVDWITKSLGGECQRKGSLR